MKAITVKQPWASLIVNGVKDIENRTWKCPEKYIGQRVLIHASKKEHDRWFETHPSLENRIRKGIEGNLTKLEYKETLGCIIGSVEIVDCVINHPSIWAEKTHVQYLSDVLEDIGTSDSPK